MMWFVLLLAFCHGASMNSNTSVMSFEEQLKTLAMNDIAVITFNSDPKQPQNQLIGKVSGHPLYIRSYLFKPKVNHNLAFSLPNAGIDGMLMVCGSDEGEYRGLVDKFIDAIPKIRYFALTTLSTGQWAIKFPPGKYSRWLIEDFPAQVKVARISSVYSQTPEWAYDTWMTYNAAYPVADDKVQMLHPKGTVILNKDRIEGSELYCTACIDLEEHQALKLFLQLKPESLPHHIVSVICGYERGGWRVLTASNLPNHDYRPDGWKWKTGPTISSSWLRNAANVPIPGYGFKEMLLPIDCRRNLKGFCFIDGHLWFMATQQSWIPGIINHSFRRCAYGLVLEHTNGWEKVARICLARAHLLNEREPEPNVKAKWRLKVTTADKKLVKEDYKGEAVNGESFLVEQDFHGIVRKIQMTVEAAPDFVFSKLFEELNEDGTLTAQVQQASVHAVDVHSLVTVLVSEGMRSSKSIRFQLELLFLSWTLTVQPAGKATEFIEEQMKHVQLKECGELDKPMNVFEELFSIFSIIFYTPPWYEEYRKKPY